MNTIRLGATLALALSTAAFARSSPRAGKLPDQVQCMDGSISAKGGQGACSRHGGIARSTQSQPTSGAANRALPPTERAPDNPASKSPWSIFGGKRKEAPAQSAPAPAANAQGRSAAPISRSPRQSDVPATAQPSAKCRDGSVSYSAHHSGSCSHHGGVAQWLDVR